MAPTRRKSDGLLARVNFPLYTLQMVTSRHILVGGGGGSSKTGVANGFVSVNITLFSAFSYCSTAFALPPYILWLYNFPHFHL